MKKFFIVAGILSLFLLPIESRAQHNDNRTTPRYIEPEITHCAYTTGYGWYQEPQGIICGTGFHQGMNVAFEFVSNQSYQINSIEGWMDLLDLDPGAIEVADCDLVIYAGTDYNKNYGYIPDTDSEIFRQHFSFDVENHCYGHDWHGINFTADNHLTLEPGTYWVAFENGSPVGGLVINSGYDGGNAIRLGVDVGRD